MRWIGIDPGLRTTGFGVIDVDGQKLTYVASGTIESGDPAKGLPERLGALYAGLNAHARSSEGRRDRRPRI
jgi:crossover junction endodeoxyribonuclease RuvC